MNNEGTFQPKLPLQFIDDGSLEPPQEVESIPLPNQLPSQIQTSSISSPIQKSRVIHSLLQQNDDLMARLSVAIRRYAQVEEKIDKLEATLQQLSSHNQILSDQILIYREKERREKDHYQENEKKIRTLEEQARTLEVQYAEYYAHSQEKQKNLVTQLDQNVRQLKLYRTYRTRINRLYKNQRSQWRQKLSEFTLAQTKWTKQTEQDKTSIQEFKSRLSATVDHIQRQSLDFESNQRTLVDNYETKLSDLSEKLTNEENRRALLETRLLDQEELEQAKIILENDNITLKRNMEDHGHRFEIELKELQKECAEFRLEAKQKSLEVQRLNESLASTENQFQESSQSNKKLMEQVESLQCLWRDAHQQLAVQKEKNEALQKLNQQLSLAFNEQRREVLQIKEQRDTQHFQSHNRIKEMEEQIKILSENVPFPDSPRQEI